MSKTATWLTGIAGAALLAAGAAAQAQSSPPSRQGAESAAASAEARVAEAKLAQTRRSEQAAIAYSRAFYEPTTTMAQRLAALAPDYVEHAPLFVRFNALNHVHGREGMRLLLETLSRLRGGGPPVRGAAGANLVPHQPRGNVLYQVVAQGDRVIVLNQQFRADPQNPGKFYETFVFDAFRIDRQGRIAEHWDYTTLPATLPVFLREPVSQIHFPKATRPIYGVGDATRQ